MKQILLDEEPSDVIIALNESIVRSRHELEPLEQDRQTCRQELDSFIADRDASNYPKWGDDDLTIEEIGIIRRLEEDERALRNKLSRATSKVTRKKNQIVKQVCETVDASEGKRRMEEV